MPHVHLKPSELRLCRSEDEVREDPYTVVLPAECEPMVMTEALSGEGVAVLAEPSLSPCPTVFSEGKILGDLRVLELAITKDGPVVALGWAGVPSVDLGPAE